MESNYRIPKNYRSLYLNCLNKYKRNLNLKEQYFENLYAPDMVEHSGVTPKQVAARVRDEIDTFDQRLYLDIFDKHKGLVSGLYKHQFVNQLRSIAVENRIQAIDFCSNPYITMRLRREVVNCYWLACFLYPKIGELYTVGDFANSRIKISI